MATTRRAAILGSVGVMAAGALALGACGTSASQAAHPPAGTPHDVVLASVGKTSASSAHLTLDMNVSGSPSFGDGSSSSSSGAAVNASMTATGDFDFATKTGQMSMTVTGLGAGDTTLQFRLVGQTVYLQLPKLATVAGKPWVKVDLPAYESAVGADDTNPFSGATAGDPSQLLQILDKLGAQVTQVGSTTIDGVPTTEYRGTIDFSNIAGQAAGGSGAGSQLAQGFAKAFGLGAVPVSVWVDDEGRARRFDMTMSFLGIHIDTTMSFSQFGEAITVTPPPADQVADGSSLLQGGQLGDILKSSTSVGT